MLSNRSKLVLALCSSFLVSCALDLLERNTSGGSVEVNISLNRTGVLQKTASLNLKNLIIRLSALDEHEICDTVTLVIATQINIIKTYDRLAAKQWTLTAISIDQNGTIVHSGSTTFIITDNDTANVSLLLAARFSQLNLTVTPIPDSADTIQIYLGDALIIKSANTGTNDSISLSYDYVPTGAKIELKCEVYGTWEGDKNVLLYFGKAVLNPSSGIDQHYELALTWVGPVVTPPEGVAIASINIGKTGTENVWIHPATPEITRDLYCFYPFTGNTFDASGNDHHATSFGAQLTSDRFGNPSSAYSFDGLDDYIISDLMSDFPEGNSSKSVTGWFRSNASNPYIMMMFGFGSAQSKYNFQTGVGPNYLSSQTEFRLNGWDDSNDWRTGTLASELLDNLWHFCTITYDGEIARFYIDGQLRNLTTQYRYYTNPSTAKIVIGREIDLAGWEFKGDLDDIRVYSRALSDAEVKIIFEENQQSNSLPH